MKCLKYSLFLVFLLIYAACMVNSNTVDDSRSSSSTATTTTTVDPTSCYAPGVGERATDYYRFPNPIIGHSATGSNVLWSSTWLTVSQQQNFLSDSILKFRIIAKENPGKIDGICNYMAGGVGSDYTKLRIIFRVSSSLDSSDSSLMTSADIPINTCTTAISMPVPANSLTPFAPIMVEVVDVWSDQRCIWSGGTSYCPMSRHDMPDCFQFEMQMVTDWTKDFY